MPTDDSVDEENELGRVISSGHNRYIIHRDDCTPAWDSIVTNGPRNYLHIDFDQPDLTFSKPKKECRLKKYRREQAEKKKKWFEGVII